MEWWPWCVLRDEHPDRELVLAMAGILMGQSGASPNTERSIVHEAKYELRHPEHFRRCGYCGSIHPVDLLIARASGFIKHVDRSVDWKYGWPHKVYVDIASAVPDEPCAIGGRSEATQGPYAPGGEKYEPPGPEYIKETELTPEQLAIVRRDGMMIGDPSPTRYIRFGKREVHHGKFYSVHTLEPFLSDQERDDLFAMIGYTFEWVTDPVDGRIRFQPYNYGRAA